MIIHATAQAVTVTGGELLTGEYGRRAAVSLSPDFDICDNAVVNFKYGETAYEFTVTDGYVDLPCFESTCPVFIGVYGYTLNGNSLTLRLSPKPFSTTVLQGSYCDAQTASPPSPSTYEALSARIESLNKPIATEISADSLNTEMAGAKAVYDAIQTALYVDSEATI